jgi:hypothetical protein
MLCIFSACVCVFCNAVVWYKFTNISELLAVSIIGAYVGGCKHLWNVGKRLPD